MRRWRCDRCGAQGSADFDGTIVCPECHAFIGGPPKIAYVGTSCVGKTTLLERSQSLNDGRVILVKEASRDYFEEHPDIDDRFSVETQGAIQSLALERERLVQRAHRLVVCDRSVLDAAVYVYAQGDRVGAQTLLDRVRDWVPTYSAIFLLDPDDVPYECDDVRTEDLETRQLFHRAFLEFFDEHDIAYELLSGSVDERLHAVSRVLEER